MRSATPAASTTSATAAQSVSKGKEIKRPRDDDDGGVISVTYVNLNK